MSGPTIDWSSAMDWAAAEAALAAWLQASLGTVPIAWSLTALQESDTWPALMLQWVANAADGRASEKTANTGGSPPFNTEITKTTRQMWQPTLRVRLYCDPANGNGQNAPVPMLQRAITALQMDSTVAALDAAGLGIETYTAITGEVDSEAPLSSWQPSAWVDITFSAAEQAKSALGYIATAEGTGTVGDLDSSITVSLE